MVERLFSMQKVLGLIPGASNQNYFGIRFPISKTLQKLHGKIGRKSSNAQFFLHEIPVNQAIY